MFDKFVRAGNPSSHEIGVCEAADAVFLAHRIQSVLDMDQVSSGIIEADVSLGLAPGHPELGLVADGALADVAADGFAAGLRLCLDGDLLLLSGTESHPAGLVDLEIVGIKIFLHN